MDARRPLRVKRFLTRYISIAEANIILNPEVSLVMTLPAEAQLSSLIHLVTLTASR